jgi:cob(I)alamin adenosyltransferase
MKLLGAEDIERLEHAIDTAEVGLPELKSFVLPGGAPIASELHRARTVCRRAERSVISARGRSPIRSELIVYLNRLSDLLFCLARRENFAAGVPDIPWNPR